MTNFDDLPNEIIIHILKYLSVAHQYESFFNLNRRFRTIIKRWMSYSRVELQRDFIRFCSLHSWYKVSLEDGGRLCFICPRRGKQSRLNRVEPNDKAQNLHWWIQYHGNKPAIDNDRIAQVVARHSFRLSPFCYGCDFSRPIDRCGHNVDIIVHINRTTYLELWLRTNYPDYANEIIRTNFTSLTLYKRIIQAEWLKTWASVREKADQIWQELRSLEDVNPLEIDMNE